jgi:hypothetical protein
LASSVPSGDRAAQARALRRISEAYNLRWCFLFIYLSLLKHMYTYISHFFLFYIYIYIYK